MRQYPRMVYKEGSHLIVKGELEEIQAGLDGYESHKNPEIVAKRKGTDKEILRPAKEELTPQQRAAITRKKNKELKEDG